MNLSDFVRLYSLRAANLSWLFGAGSSVFAGLPSAYDLIWDFKRQLYCSEQGYPVHFYNNLSDSSIRSQIQSYFDGKGNYPTENSVGEYSWYFEKAYPSEKSRSEYITQIMSNLQLTYGHKVIGTLMRLGFLKLIFTTNFDKAFENIAVKEFQDNSRWFCADLDNSDAGLKQYQDNRYPLIVKLHGDFKSDKLKNIAPELKEQDKNLRHILTTSSFTKGLCIMGYSGRDESIMEALFSALDQDNTFPQGIFWFVKSGTEPMPIVNDFIKKARKKRIEAELIEIETFDTAWAEIAKGFGKMPKHELDKLNENYFRRANRPLPNKGTKLPVIRLNAIKINKYPATARVYKCEAGNIKEVKELISSTKADIIATRKKVGIVGFGADIEFKKAFQSYGNATLDLYNISESTLTFDDSTIKEIITEALCKALVNGKPLVHLKRRGRYVIIPDPKQINDNIFQSLANELGSIMGTIPESTIKWITSLDIVIQYKLQSTYLILTPGILAAKANESTKLLIAPFIKEFTARWYNNKFDRLLNIWLNILFGDKQEITIKAFDNMVNGINASFTLNKTTLHTKLI